MDVGKFKYSRVHNRWNEVFFQDSEETISRAEINDTSNENQADFYWEKTKQNFCTRRLIAGQAKLLRTEIVFHNTLGF